ncbi:MAG: LuxR C-terminal-related transcriptional regulator [Methylococcales bacterium]
MPTVLLGCRDRRVILHWSSSLGTGYRIDLASDLDRVFDQCRSRRNFVLIVIDYALLADNYEENLSRLQLNAPDSKILLIGRKLSCETQLKAFSRGIPGYMEADSPADLLIKGVNRLLHDEVWVGRQMVTSLLELLRKQNTKPVENSTPGNLAGLTPREMEIAGRVCQGESNKKIAKHLEITERTVKAHMGSIFRKLEVIDRLQLALRLKDCFSEHPMIIRKVLEEEQ